MRKSVIFIALLFSLAPVLMASQLGKATLSWATQEKDLGTIAKGVPVRVEFSFENTGDAPLVISEVKTSCGCTASDWPREAVAPGKTAHITATYNAANAGVFHKTITVHSNAQEAVTTLVIKGTVSE